MSERIIRFKPCHVCGGAFWVTVAEQIAKENGITFEYFTGYCDECGIPHSGYGISYPKDVGPKYTIDECKAAFRSFDVGEE